MTETPEIIYLIPGEDVDGAPCMAQFVSRAREAADRIESDAEEITALRQQLTDAEQSCRARIKADRLYCLEHGDEVAQEIAEQLKQARQIITDLVEYAEQNDPGCPHISKSKEFLACRSDK